MSLVPEPLRIPAFRYFWLARLASTIGQMAMVIVIGWQVYDIARHTMGLKEAALRLGIIGVVQFVPLFLLTLVTGWTADRLDRRWIARAVGRARAWLRRGARLARLDQTPRRCRSCIVVAALLGVARAFAGPALGALAPNLVPREILPRAIALSLDRLADGRGARPGDRRLPLRLRPHAPYAASGACSRWRSSACCDPARRPDRARARLQSLGADGRGLEVRPPQPPRARRDQPRPVRGVARRSDSNAAGLRPRRSPCRTGRLGHLRAAPAVGATLTAAFFSIRPLKHDVGARCS